jgi:cytochrome d ubiquinol oxidase subunit II
LWLLVLRGAAIKFRSMLENPLWRAAWDATFAFASASLAIVLGVALGNIVRGLPLDESGYFQEDLFASSRGAHAGAIDPFTGVFGAFALVVLAAHGATFLAWKTAGELGRRSRKTAQWLWSISLALGAVATFVTAIAEPLFFQRIVQRPWLWSLALSAFASATVAILSVRSERRELRAFLASCGFIASMLLATAGALYPTILRSTVNAAFTLDVVNASSARTGLVTGLLLLGPALVVAIGYFVYLFRIFRGKAEGHDPHYGE